VDGIMGYLHIDNLYKNQTVMQFKECYALEKIHGTSAHITWAPGYSEANSLSFFSGGEAHERFVALFNKADLHARFVGTFGTSFDLDVTVYGEAYGGKQQGMSGTYGKDLKFVAFDVKIGERWLDVPSAERLVVGLGLEFVSYERIPTDLPVIDAERDKPSEQAVRNGITEPKLREGVVLRPLIEVQLNNGSRVIAKHKRDEFRETSTPRVVDPSKQEALTEANAIAEEWVTPMRLEHVIGQLISNREYKRAEMSDIKAMIELMTADVLREGEGEFVDSKEVRKAIGARTVVLFKQHLNATLVGDV
jgi:hypothetical protein